MPTICTLTPVFDLGMFAAIAASRPGPGAVISSRASFDRRASEPIAQMFATARTAPSTVWA